MFKKGIFAWIASGTISGAAGLITCQGFFHWLYATGPEGLYRTSMVNQEISWLITAGSFGFLFAGVFVAGYALMYNVLPAKGLGKGLIYGLLIWLIGFIFPVLRIYLSVNLPVAIVIYWILNALLGYLLMGAITGMVYKK